MKAPVLVYWNCTEKRKTKFLLLCSTEQSRTGLGQQCDRIVIFGWSKVLNSHSHLKLVQPFLLQLFCLEQELKSTLPLLVGEEEPVAPLPEDKKKKNNCLKIQIRLVCKDLTFKYAYTLRLVVKSGTKSWHSGKLRGCDGRWQWGLVGEWVRGKGAHFILHSNRQPEATLEEWTHSSPTFQCVCENMCAWVHLCGVAFMQTTVAASHPCLHPGQCCESKAIVKLLKLKV